MAQPKVNSSQITTDGSIGSVVQLVSVGSPAQPSLPAVDGSQLINLPISRPGFELLQAAVGSPLQTVFNTTVGTVSNYALANELRLQVFVNGTLQLEDLPGSPTGTKDYSVTGANQITFNVGVLAGADVVFCAF